MLREESGVPAWNYCIGLQSANHSSGGMDKRRNRLGKFACFLYYLFLDTVYLAIFECLHFRGFLIL